MYYLEKLPSKFFKIMMQYIATMHEGSKQRVIDDARQLVENKDDIKLDDLETQLISEADDQDERKELKTKIINAKIKRIEKVAELSV